MSGRTAPSAARSRVGCAFSAAAAAGRLRLQRCADCGAVCYPAREACPQCWSAALAWADMPEGGELLTESTLHVSFNPYFQARLPWRVGTVKLDAGPAVLAHVHAAVGECARVRVIARTDQSGQGVLVALPEQGDLNMVDDPKLSALSCDPRGRRVLVSGADGPIGRAITETLAKAGAAVVYAGTAGSGDALPNLAGVEPVMLDPAEDDSVAAAAEAVGASVDIVVNAAGLARPGEALTGGLGFAQEEMATNYFGLLRLVRGFGPALRERSAGDGALRAWVNVLSVHALCGATGYGTSAASNAAALSLAQALRAELAGSGVKVIDVLAGPLDDDWNAALPPPKVSAAQVAAAVSRALREGLERVAVGPIAEDILERFEAGPMALEREEMRP